MYNQRSDHRERKLLAHTLSIPIIICYDAIFSKKLVVSHLLSCLFNWLRLVADWLRPMLHNNFEFAYEF